MRAINIKKMHEVNISLLLNTIRVNSPISRSEISRLIHLSPSAVSNIVDLFIKTGFVSEVTNDGANVIRRNRKLILNEERYFPIGIEIENDRILGIVINLVGDVLKQELTYFSPNTDYKEILNKVIEIFYTLVKDFSSDQIMGVGIAIPGSIDTKQGISIFSPNLGWRNVHVKEFIKDKINFPIFIEHNVKAVTLGELWYGAGVGRDNLICVRVGSGVSAGFVIDGNIYQGLNGLAGEFGHTVVEKDGKRCRCGSYGCLETYVSTQVLIDRVLEGIREGAYTQISLENKTREQMLEEIFLVGKKGDKFILNIFEKMGEYLGIGISNLINIFNPGLVVIAGGLARAGDLLLDPVKKTVQLHAFSPIPEITTSKLGSLTCAIGAATLVIKDAFSHPQKRMEALTV